MRHHPEEYGDHDEARRIGAEPWMLDLLKCNPPYVSWGPHEDYMIGGEGSWRGPLSYTTWSDHEITLDELNEVVNFYFQIERESSQCPDCEGHGTNKAVKALSDDWYDFAETGRKWIYKLEQVEIDALWDAGRLRYSFKEKPSPAQVNSWAQGRGLGHDAINQWICVEARAKSLGIYSECATCEKTGYVYTEDAPRLSLVYWLCHPRKGASRGVEVGKITRDQIPEVADFLKEARDRNNDRFSGVDKISIAERNENET